MTLSPSGIKAHMYLVISYVKIVSIRPLLIGSSLGCHKSFDSAGGVNEILLQVTRVNYHKPALTKLMTARKSIETFTKMLGNSLTKDLIELMHSNAKE